MKNEWLTTLLKQKGLRLSGADLASLLEEISPKARNGALSYVLNWLRPFSAGMGLRVARLGDQHIELVVPSQIHNQAKEGHLHEGVLFSSGLEALRLLWDRHAPFGEFGLFLKKSQFEIRQNTRADVRVRVELLEANRETMLASLRRSRHAEGEAQVAFYGDKDQLIGELIFTYEIYHTPSLESKVSKNEQKG